MEFPPYLILVRGIPGSGKSSFAKSLMSIGDGNRKNIKHFEADQYFDGPHGYEFNPDMLYAAHHSCLYNTEQSLREGYTTIVSNTFTTLKEMRPYFKLAATIMNEFPFVVTANGAFTNVHGVPEDKLLIMRNRFTHDLTPLYREFVLKPEGEPCEPN